MENKANFQNRNVKSSNVLKALGFPRSSNSCKEGHN